MKGESQRSDVGVLSFGCCERKKFELNNEFEENRRNSVVVESQSWEKLNEKGQNWDYAVKSKIKINRYYIISSTFILYPKYIKISRGIHTSIEMVLSINCVS